MTTAATASKASTASSKATVSSNTTQTTHRKDRATVATTKEATVNKAVTGSSRTANLKDTVRRRLPTTQAARSSKVDTADHPSKVATNMASSNTVKGNSNTAKQTTAKVDLGDKAPLQAATLRTHMVTTATRKIQTTRKKASVDSWELLLAASEVDSSGIRLVMVSLCATSSTEALLTHD